MAKKPDDLDEIMRDIEDLEAPREREESVDDLLPDEVPALLHDLEEGEDAPPPGADLLAPETAEPEFVTVPVAPKRQKKISQGGQIVKSEIALRAGGFPGVPDVAPVDPNLMIVEILQKMQKEFDNISGEILGTWRSDRDQIQEVIDIYLNVVRGGGDLPRVYVEMLVKALEVKSNTSITAVKLLDAKTRLLQALKGGTSVMIQNNNAVVGDGDLTKLLSEPMSGDFVGE